MAKQKPNKAQVDQQQETSDTPSKKQVQSAEFPEAPEGTAATAGSSIDILLDMTVPVSVIIGRTEIAVHRLLQLGPGSVLKLDKSIDAPVDLYLKETKFATGEVVVVDGRFAVRIKEILGAAKATGEPVQAAAPT